MLRHFLALLLLTGLPLASAAAEPVTDLRKALGSVELWPQIEIYEDRTARMSAQQVAHLPDSAWSAVAQRNGHHGIGGSRVLWARFGLRSLDDTPAQWMLEHRQSFVDKVHLYRLENSNPVAVRGLRETSLDWMSGVPNPAFALELDPGGVGLFLLRIDTLSLLRTPLHAVEMDQYDRSQRRSYLLRGVLLAIPVLASLFMALVWMVHRERSLPVFIGMLATEAVGECWIGGMFHIAMPWLSADVIGKIGFAAILLAIIMSFRHALLFLDLDHAMPSMARLFRLIQWLIPLAYIPELLDLGWGRNAVILAWAACSGLLFIASIAQARRGHSFADIYALAWGTFVLSAALILANLGGWIAPNLSNLTLYAQGSIVSLVFCYAAIGQVRERERQTQLALMAAQSARERSQARTRLFAATNHDMRQPVQSLGLFIELMRKRGPGMDIDGLVAKLRSAYLSLSDFLDGLMSAVQLESGTLKPRPADFPLQSLLEPLVEEYRELARVRQLSVRYVATSAWIHGDRMLLERIVRNLLANAVRYTETGRVLLGVRRRPGSLSIQVLDTGCGLSPKSQSRIFDEFTRFADGSDGVGLGLANVHGLCRLLGYTVGVRSIPGRGSCFSVTIPVTGAA